MAEKTGNAFDMQIFKRLMSFAKRYRLYFFIASSSTILLALFSVLSPLLLINTVNDYILANDKQGLLNYTLLMLSLIHI